MQQCFETLSGYNPYPWQVRLFEAFIAGSPPQNLSIPTGAGKSNVITVWLCAVLHQIKNGGSNCQALGIPRRLYFAIDRRVIVDQAEVIAQQLLQKLQQHSDLLALLKSQTISDEPLVVSVLRGQRVTEQESIISDPSAFAIVLCTPDMVLSRLLFNAYRADLTEALQEVKMKPSEVGIDQVPDFKAAGTLDTTGATIERVVTFSLAVLDVYKSNLELYDYLVSLSLIALLSPIPLELRSGTTLVRAERKIEIYADLKPAQFIAESGLFEEVLAFARASAKRFGIGAAESLDVDTDKIILNAKMFREKKESTKAKKTGDSKKAKVGAA